MFKEPSVSIYKAKDVHVNGKEYPEYTVLIGTANIVLQFFLPLTEENKNKHVANSSLEFEIFPASILDDKLRYTKDGNVQFDINFTSHDLTGLNKETEDERISFKGEIPKC